MIKQNCMRDVAIIGGPGTGKDTLVSGLESRIPRLHKIYMAQVMAYIPLRIVSEENTSLLDLPSDRWKEADVFKCSRAEYIARLLERQNYTDFPKIERQKLIDMGKTVREVYGDNAEAVFCSAFRLDGRVNVFNNVSRTANVKYLKDSGVYVVGLHCSFDEQVRRRMNEARDIDPKKPDELATLIRRNIDTFETEACLLLADVKYDTMRQTKDQIADSVAELLK